MTIDKKQLVAAGSAALVLLALFVAPNFFEEDTPEVAVEEASYETFVNPFDSVALEAEAAYVYDIARGEVLFEKNAETQLPLASLSKLMSGVLVLERASNKTVVIPQEALSQEGDNGLLAGEEWSLADLLDLTLITSSNDGIYALALASGLDVTNGDKSRDPRLEFVRLMNEKSMALGLTQTYFLNESGLDFEEAGISGGYGSARDVAHLFEYILANHPGMIEATREAVSEIVSLSDIPHEAENTNDSVNAIPLLIGGKTGFTDLAGGNLVIAFDAGIMHPIIVTVLGSTLDGRFSDTETLVSAARAYIADK